MNKLEIGKHVKKFKTFDISLLRDAFDKASEYVEEALVIKISGKILSDNEALKRIIEDIILLKSIGIEIIIVHGGLELAYEFMDNFEIKKNADSSIFNMKTIEIIEMMISGYINKNIVNMINLQGKNAIGISGKDGNLLLASKKKVKLKANQKIANILDHSYLGDIIEINPEILFGLEDTGLIPVISPIAFGENGETFHVDSDTVAAEIASSVSALKLVLITDNDGITDKSGKLIPNLTSHDVYKIIDKNSCDEDIIKKLKICLRSLEDGIEKIHLISGWKENGLLYELFSDNRIGSQIYIK